MPATKTPKKPKKATKKSAATAKADAQPVKLAADVRMIALDRLARDPINVRVTDAEAGVAELADSIYAHGLQSPLSVRPVDAEGVYFTVLAGGRRLAALQLLQKDGRIKFGEFVPCVLHRAADDDAAAERASLAENLDRLPMNVVDQFDVFRRQVDNRGATERDLASAYGVTIRYVRQVLALARLHPDLVALLRANELAMGVAELLTSVDDVDEQVRLFKASYGQEYRLRDLLRREKIASDDPLVKLVGLAAYKAAGGTIAENLFSTSPSDRLLNEPALLKRLAAEKIGERRDALLKDGWAFVTDETQPDAPSRWSLATHYGEPKTKKGRAGIAIHLIVSGGELCEVRHKPSAALAKKHGVTLPATGKKKAIGGSSAADAGERLSPSAVADVTRERTEILRNALMLDPDAALDLLLARLVPSLLVVSGHLAFDVPVELTLRNGLPDSLTVGHAAASPFAEPYHKRVDELHDLAPKNLAKSSELLGWISTLKSGQKRELLALCVASGLNTFDNGGGGRANQATLALARLDVDLPAAYRPDGKWFTRRNKQQIAADVAEAVGDDRHTAELLAMKKAAAAERAEAIVKPTRWLPPPLRAGLDVAGSLRPPTVRTCRVCGCTDDDCSICIERTGEPCHWVAGDLCSACVPTPDDGGEKPAAADSANERERSNAADAPQTPNAPPDADDLQMGDSGPADRPAADLRWTERGGGHFADSALTVDDGRGGRRPLVWSLTPDAGGEGWNVYDETDGDLVALLDAADVEPRNYDPHDLADAKLAVAEVEATVRLAKRDDHAAANVAGCSWTLNTRQSIPPLACDRSETIAVDGKPNAGRVELLTFEMMPGWWVAGFTLDRLQVKLNEHFSESRPPTVLDQAWPTQHAAEMRAAGMVVQALEGHADKVGKGLADAVKQWARGRVVAQRRAESAAAAQKISRGVEKNSKRVKAKRATGRKAAA